MYNKTVGIIGGGAAGLMAAITAVRSGCECCIFDVNDNLGKKILSTGNGRCNYTNSNMDYNYFNSDNIEFVKTALEQFGHEDTVKFFRELGVVPRNKNGYFYPISNQASTIRSVLESEVNRLGVDLYLSTKVKSISKSNEGFHLKTTDGTYVVDKCILATGGLSTSYLGNDGSGFNMVYEFGHKTNKITPALVPLTVDDKAIDGLAGVRCAGSVTLFVNGAVMASDTGELQFNKDSISGIPVFQVSRFATQALKDKLDVYTLIDFVPFMSDSELTADLRTRFSSDNWGRTAYEALNGLLNDKVINLILSKNNIPADSDANALSPSLIPAIRDMLKNFRVTINGSKGFDSAQVTAGGILLTNINPKTMESNYCPGLHFAGEVMDVDGPCGGYNLQWAWTSGYLAGRGVANDNC